jgi:hypothetical protein
MAIHRNLWVLIKVLYNEEITVAVAAMGNRVDTLK